MSLLNIVKLVGSAITGVIVGAGIGYGGYKLYTRVSDRVEVDKEMVRSRIRNILGDIKEMARDRKVKLTAEMQTRITMIEGKLLDPSVRRSELEDHWFTLLTLYNVVMSEYIDSLRA